jgi:hypothetical protein
MSFPRLSRTVSSTLALGVLATTALTALSGSTVDLVATRTTTVEQRVSDAPNVFFPVVSKYAKDLRTYGRRPGTEIQAPCGAAVRAATAGTALVSASRTSGPNLVRVVTSKGKLVSYYGYMNRATVTSGQVVAAGQQVGNVGHLGIAKHCALYFSVTNGTSGVIKLNPSTWLNNYVGKPLPQSSLFDNNGFTLASFNSLGAVHTPTARYPGYAARTPKQVTMLNGYGVDVVGMQEFEPKQRDLFLATAGSTYGIWPQPDAPRTDNSLLWRNSTMEFISGTTMGIPYFQGRTAQVPVVLLRQRATGREAYFINVHNPASIAKYGDQSRFRAQAIAVEKAKIVALRRTGLPVFVTGDFNDREKAFCPLTAGKLMISANSIPSMTCALPRTLWIDWVFAAGPARFTSWVKDMKPRTLAISDHPIIVTHAYIAAPEPARP